MYFTLQFVFVYFCKGIMKKTAFTSMFTIFSFFREGFGWNILQEVRKIVGADLVVAC